MLLRGLGALRSLASRQKIDSEISSIKVFAFVYTIIE